MQKFQTNISQEFMSVRSTKNMFTSTDTRHKQIKILESKNKKLSQQLVDLQYDIKEIDEFKLAMTIDRQPVKSNRQLIFETMDAKKGKLEAIDSGNNDFHQRRVDILKAQIQKQQRYIKRITTILQTTRYFYADLKEYLKYFSQVIRQSNQPVFQVEEHDIIFNHPAVIKENLEQQLDQQIKKVASATKIPDFEDSFDKQHNRNITRDKEHLELVDKKQQHISLKNLLNQFRSNEDRENFISTFSMAYQKILETERPNIDFKNLFQVIKAPNGQQKLKYRHPIRLFLKQYGHIFPVRSIYNSFPVKDRERFEHLLINLDGMSAQIQRDISKIDTFWLFKSNPYYFNDYKGGIALPIHMMEEQQLYEQFLSEPEKFRTINLDHQSISNLEKDLLQLLDQLLQLQNNYQKECSGLQFMQNHTLNNLSTQIRQTLESLVCLSSMIGNNNQQSVNKIQIMTDKSAYLYNYNLFSISEFEQKNQQLEQLLGDLGDVVNNSELQIVRKAQIVVKSIKNIYEIQKMITTIRDNEIQFLKSKLNLILQDYERVSSFISDAERRIKFFFGNINSRFNSLVNQYVIVLEQDKLNDPNFRRQFSQLLRKQLKDLGDFITGYSNIDYNDNSINIKQLQLEFDKKK
ncbi:hypothetical protein pb186bvf_011080 [Paramecium bursaria]